MTQSLCSLFHWLAETREDGRLDLIREPIRKSVFFEEGHPVFATSNIESERFGEYLVAHGELSREQHAEVLDFAARKGIRFTEALLALDVCTPNQLFTSLGAQVRDRILDLFTWTDGILRALPRLQTARPCSPAQPPLPHADPRRGPGTPAPRDRAPDACARPFSARSFAAAAAFPPISTSPAAS